MDIVESTTSPDPAVPLAGVPAGATERHIILRSLARGGVAGVVATLTMSAALVVQKELGLLGQHPPKKMVRGIRRRSGLVGTSQRMENAAVTAAHFGFGAASGMLFGVAHRRSHGWAASPLLGAGFGIAVWGASYYGWVPALGLMELPHRDRPFRPTSMVAAHVVFGTVLGALVEGATRSRRNSKWDRPGSVARLGALASLVMLGFAIR